MDININRTWWCALSKHERFRECSEFGSRSQGNYFEEDGSSVKVGFSEEKCPNILIVPHTIID